MTSTVFERGSLVPSAKMLTFYRSQPFTIKAEYTPDSNIPSTADRSIGKQHCRRQKLPICCCVQSGCLVGWRGGSDTASPGLGPSWATLVLAWACAQVHATPCSSHRLSAHVCACPCLRVCCAGSFDVGPFQLPAGADKAKLKVKVMLNLNGVVVVEHAQVIEEEEYEEEAAAAAPAAADQPMEDADAAKAAGAEGGAAAPEAADAAAAPAPAAGGDAPMAEDAVGAAEPQKVLKKRVKKHSVPFVSHTAALSADQLQKLYEVEVELALQVGWEGRVVEGCGGGGLGRVKRVE